MMPFTSLRHSPRASFLKRRALGLHAPDFVWCQRGGGPERVALVCAFETELPDLAILVFSTSRGTEVRWFTARLYLTTEATVAAGLAGQLNHHFRAGRQTMGIRAEPNEYTYRVLSNKLSHWGVPVLLQRQLGILPVMLQQGRTYARAA